MAKLTQTDQEYRKLLEKLLEEGTLSKEQYDAMMEARKAQRKSNAKPARPRSKYPLLDKIALYERYKDLSVRYSEFWKKALEDDKNSLHKVTVDMDRFIKLYESEKIDGVDFAVFLETQKQSYRTTDEYKLRYGDKEPPLLSEEYTDFLEKVLVPEQYKKIAESFNNNEDIKTENQRNLPMVSGDKGGIHLYEIYDSIASGKDSVLFEDYSILNENYELLANSNIELINKLEENKRTIQSLTDRMNEMEEDGMAADAELTASREAVERLTEENRELRSILESMGTPPEDELGEDEEELDDGLDDEEEPDEEEVVELDDESGGGSSEETIIEDEIIPEEGDDMAELDNAKEVFRYLLIEKFLTEQESNIKYDIKKKLSSSELLGQYKAYKDKVDGDSKSYDIGTGSKTGTMKDLLEDAGLTLETFKPDGINVVKAENYVDSLAGYLVANPTLNSVLQSYLNDMTAERTVFTTANQPYLKYKHSVIDGMDEIPANPGLDDIIVYNSLARNIEGEVALKKSKKHGVVGACITGGAALLLGGAIGLTAFGINFNASANPKDWTPYKSDLDEVQGNYQVLEDDYDSLEAKFNNLLKDIKTIYSYYSGDEGVTKETSSTDEDVKAALEDVYTLISNLQGSSESVESSKATVEYVTRELSELKSFNAAKDYFKENEEVSLYDVMKYLEDSGNEYAAPTYGSVDSKTAGTTWNLGDGVTIAETFEDGTRTITISDPNAKSEENKTIVYSGSTTENSSGYSEGEIAIANALKDWYGRNDLVYYMKDEDSANISEYEMDGSLAFTDYMSTDDMEAEYNHAEEVGELESVIVEFCKSNGVTPTYNEDGSLDVNSAINGLVNVYYDSFEGLIEVYNFFWGGFDLSSYSSKQEAQEALKEAYAAVGITISLTTENAPQPSAE